MTRDDLLMIAAAALGFLFTFWLLGSARAHDGYSDWMMPDSPTMSCCHDADCRPVRAHSDLEGQWTAVVDGERVLVPPNKVMKIHNNDGRSHWCGKNGVTYCFLPGEVRG